MSTTSHRNLPARASLLILSTKRCAAEAKVFDPDAGIFVFKLLSMLPTIAPPVSVPYQTTSPSFCLFNRWRVLLRSGGVC